MNIPRGREAQRLLEEQTKKGRFATADEAMRAALHSFDASTRVSDYENLPAETRATLEESEEQFDRGEGRPRKEVRSEILLQFTDK